MADDPLVKVVDAAERLGVDPRTVRVWAKSDGIGEWMGTRLVLRESDVTKLEQLHPPETRGQGRPRIRQDQVKE